MVVWDQLTSAQFRFVAAVVVLFGGLVFGHFLGRFNVRILQSIGVPGSVEGTTVERTARKFGTSTVAVIGRLTSWIVYFVAALVALEVAGYFGTVVFLIQAGNIIPNLVLAVAILVFGLLVADKAEVFVSESLRSVKLPEIGLLPTVVRYTVVFVSILLALAQVGISTTALVVLLGAYVFAAVVFSAVAFRHLLSSGAAGVYLLLNEPYGIGDRVAVAGREGIVQEVDVFVTLIEAEDREFVVPNHLVLREGAVLILD
ncbi:mechanosensitive ion channel domain-containing protein [Halanaeroarchaeum sulfurireducens]|uniref:MscS mechanosensitive ion channel n=1 Tax=Halanaeroarchaeum sulfurireducens TaxID=1604004 RepID=A0A0F7PAB7_9EURY|nr:mechanosensitive ion channel domain-containing protein [Halanaeroarchaeum sulfurireducens]AKH98101.1 MscS mechanosensitive ion channel [Halanaeroarchaeum sulfurireducens]